MNSKKNLKIIFYLIIFIWLVINLIRFPNNCIIAAKKGLLTWFNIIVPSLFPFFIITDLLINFGFVDLIGTLLEPLMKPIFNVSGKGAFPLVMSFTSGYPVGVKLISSLRKENTFTKVEAQRLLSFCSTSGPIFMIGAVSTGMLNNQTISPLIVLPHYLGAITVGIIFRFYQYKRDKNNQKFTKASIKNSFNKLLNYSNNVSIANLLANSIKSGFSSLTIIGGFMIFYSVVVEILKTSNFIDIINNIIIAITPLKTNCKILEALLPGLFEITIGCVEISNLTELSFLSKIMIINFLIGWSGFSIHSQALSFIQTTDLNGKIYVFSKLLHGSFSSIYSYILYKLKYTNLTLPSFKPQITFWNTLSITSWIKVSAFSLQILLHSIVFLIIYGLIISSINKILFNK
ncbi:sporulation integral membrane protein YlbJ [Anaerosalibacter sp. Marseille-P3206]|uniref:sporulation integral membrane protein YlbJ n=1 Tax=Anaerosalibacter sp. Marseille-P3206 TaxID=1871005 RepID=UPI000985BF53|nr:sporulation integral membrane protein YlbJ [Anaerosalibacter sp. Marseille-P3206]